MHGAVAATEAVCDASRKLVANAMHCQTIRLQAPSGMRINRSVVLLLSVLETDEKKREWRVRKLGTIGSSVFCFWLAERVFPLQRQATSNSQHRHFCLLSACFLGWKKCTYTGLTQNPSRHASQKRGLPTRRLGWLVERCTR